MDFFDLFRAGNARGCGLFYKEEMFFEIKMPLYKRRNHIKYNA